MKLSRVLSLLLVLAALVSLMGTIGFAAEEKTEYTPADTFTVSTDDQRVPYYMGTSHPKVSGAPYYFLKGGGTTSKIEGYSKTSLPTTANLWEATPVYIEQVANGYRMYYMKEENKSYIAITSGGATNNQKDQTDAKNTFTWDAENKVFFQMDTVNGETEPVKYILAITTDSAGDAKTRITAEKWDDYLANESSNVRKIYPVRLFTQKEVGVRDTVSVENTPVVSPEEGKPYFLTFKQGDKGANGTVYYWIGRVVDTTAALFLETTTDNGRAAIVFLEKSGSGWKLTEMLNGQKKYIYLYKKGSDMALGLADEARYATEFRWDDEYCTFIGNYLGTDIFMGVNSELNEDGSVKTPYTKIKPLKTTVLGADHRFPVFLVAVPDSVEVETPPPPETEPPTTAPEETGPVYVPVSPNSQNKMDSNVQIAGFIVSAILMAGGIALVLLDRKKSK